VAITICVFIFVLSTLQHFGWWSGTSVGCNHQFLSRWWLQTRAVEPELKLRGLQLQASKKSKNTMYYLYNWLAQQTMSVEPEPKFQAPAPPSKVPAPDPQPCFKWLWMLRGSGRKPLTPQLFWETYVPAAVVIFVLGDCVKKSFNTMFVVRNCIARR